MRTVSIFARCIPLVLLGAVCVSCMGGDGASDVSLALEIPFTMPDVQECGRSPYGFFVTSMEEELQLWTWKEGTLSKTATVALPMSHCVRVLKDAYVACVYPGDDHTEWPLVATSLSDMKTIGTWVLGLEWYFAHVGTSANGRFIVVISGGEDVGTVQFRHIQRVGLIDGPKGKLNWIAELQGMTGSIQEIAASDDGSLVAIGGWENALTVIESKTGKILWSLMPSMINPCYVAFSPDGETVYVGDGGGGGAAALDARSGKVLRRWHTTPNGRPGMGARLSCMALSPDGQWLAAGAAPGGQVYLWNTQHDGPARVLRRGRISTLVVTFSPDSRHLGDVGSGNIRIWSLPPGDPPASTPAATRPAAVPS